MNKLLNKRMKATLAAELPRAMRSALDRHRAAATGRIVDRQGAQ